MVDIMSHLHQYVPTVKYTEDITIPGGEEGVQIPKALFHKILFGGDQLTVARARGAQRIRMNSMSPQTRLEGLIPCIEDWHTKLNLLGVNNSVYKQPTYSLFSPGYLEVFLLHEVCCRAQYTVSTSQSRPSYKCCFRPSKRLQCL